MMLVVVMYICVRVAAAMMDSSDNRSLCWERSRSSSALTRSRM